MRLRVPHALVRRSWWWVFGLCIAMPAVALALLGIGGLRADDLERENRRRDREAQLVRLVDAALGNVLDHVSSGTRPDQSMADPPSDVGPSPTDSIRFELSADGRLLFPDDRTVVGGESGPPREARPNLPRAAAALVEEARAAEAQGRTAEAKTLYEQLRAYAPLRPWIGFQQALLDVEVLDGSAVARLPRDELARSDASSPGGIPLAIVAAGLSDAMTPGGRRAFAHFLAEARASLQAGRWWLSLDQRRAYGAEFDRWLAEAGVEAGDRGDVRLEAITQAAPLIRQVMTETPGARDRAEMAGAGSSRFLIVWTRPVEPSAGWHGVAVPGPSADTAFEAALEPLVGQEPVRLAIHDRSFMIWGRDADAGATRYALDAVAGWSLLVTDVTPPVAFQRRVLNYGRVVLPIVVLGFGLLMTVWVVRREMALTSLQSEFVAAVTHEFKSPITSIRLLIERITSGRLGARDSPDRYLAAIGAETDRLEGLVNRLLEARKLQDGQREYRFQAGPIEALVGDAVRRLQPQAAAKRMSIAVTVAPSLPRLDIDTESMLDAITNLIDNAIKYSPEGSSVAISVERSGGDVRVTVADEGVGVQPADAQRIFEPFFRSRRGDHANVHGTGLGLSLVKATAEAHGGTVTVQSDGVRGSRFVLAVPIAERAPHMESSPAPDAAGPISPAAGTSRR